MHKMNLMMKEILEANVQSGEIALWWLGQSGFILKTPDRKITVIDPYLSNSAGKLRNDLNRMVPVPIQPDELVCDYYICTHNHADHADPETIRSLNNKQSMLFIGPRNVAKSFPEWDVPANNILMLEAGESLALGEITLTGTFCIPNSDKVLDSIGIIFQSQNKVIYHSGDTGYHPFMEYLKKFNIDIALLCINGKFGNMTYKEAFRLNESISARFVVPCHFDMFPINLEDPGLFRELFKEKREEDQCIIPEIGKCIRV